MNQPIDWQLAVLGAAAGLDSWNKALERYSVGRRVLIRMPWTQAQGDLVYYLMQMYLEQERHNVDSLAVPDGLWEQLK